MVKHPRSQIAICQAQGPFQDPHSSGAAPPGTPQLPPPPRQLLHPGLMLRADRALPSGFREVKSSLSGSGPETGVPSALTPPSPPPTQDTADYVKPVTFSVEYSLQDPDHGPMLDDGWPTALRVSVRPGTQGTQLGAHPSPTPTCSREPRPESDRYRGILPPAHLPTSCPANPPHGSLPRSL